MSTTERVAKNTGYLLVKMLFSMIASLIITRLLLNSLGISDYGVFNVVGGIIAMLGFLNAAMSQTTQRFMNYIEGEGNLEKIQTVFNISVILHLIIAFIVGLLLEIAYFIFFNGLLNIPESRIFAAKFIYHCMVMSTMFTIMTVPYDSVLNAHENMLYYSIIGIIDVLLKLIIAIVVVYIMVDKLILFGILTAIETIIIMIITRIYCNRNYIECVFNPRVFFDKKIAKSITKFASWNFLQTSVYLISGYGQNILLNHFFGSMLNAAQGIVSQLNGQLQTLSSNMLKSLNPIIGKSAGANDKKMLEKSSILGAKFSALLFCIVAVPLYGVLPYALKLWLGIIPEWTIIFMKLQLVKTFIDLLFTTLPGAIFANGNIKGYTIFNAISNSIMLPLSYLFFKLGFPPYIMYINIIVFSSFIGSIVNLYYVRKFSILDISKFLKITVLPIVMLVVSFILFEEFLSSFFEINSIIKFLGCAVFYVVLFVLSSYIFVCNRSEKEMLAILYKNVSTKVLKKKA